METVNYGRNMFYDTGLGAQGYKSVYGLNLQIVLKSWSVCSWQAFPA